MSSTEFEFDVLCYGTISADNLIYVPFLPNPRRDSHVRQEFNRLGGEAVTVSCALSAWGLRVAIAGNVIGEDYWGGFIREGLKDYPGIETRHIEQRADVQTPFCRILVTPDGERSILGYWFDDAPKTALREALMSKARLLSVDVYGREERDEAARMARRLGRPVVSADAIWPHHPLAGLSDIIVISSDFLHQHFPGVYIYDHVLELQKTARAGDIVVTQGRDPVLVVNKRGRPKRVNPFPATVVDTTGAGDIFKAAIIYGYLQGWPLTDSVRFACAASSLHIQQPPGQRSPPDLAKARSLAGV